MTAKKCQKQAGTCFDQLEGGGFWGNGFYIKWRGAGVAVEYASAVWYPRFGTLYIFVFVYLNETLDTAQTEYIVT